MSTPSPSPSPNPTVGDKPSLATPDDIVARLGRNMNQIEAARVDAMLQDGSAYIRRFARTDFLHHAQDVIKIVADASRFKIPGRPIYSIDGLIALSGAPGIPDIPVSWYVFDGIDTITIPAPWASGIINLPAYWYNLGWFSNTFQLTYTHGEQSTPMEVHALLCSAIISELSTPTMSATLQSEAIGSYSYTMRRSLARGSTGGQAMAGIYAALLDFGMEDILRDYRRKQGTIAVSY
jgi:hypothetical protein